METRKITRYANRKLYDHKEVGYVTLEEVGDAIREGHEIAVTDKVKRCDITNDVLLNVIANTEKAKPFHCNKLLTRIVRAGGMTSYTEQLEGRLS